MADVNPLVFECNDGYLNDIQALAIQEAHYHRALQAGGRASNAVRPAPGAACRASN